LFSSWVKKKEELITSAMTFAASANCALYCNAKPVFVDINEQGLIDEKKIGKKITKKTKIIIPVHYTGLVCEMEKIKKISDKHNLIIIEDACHALGAKYKGSKIGDCKYSDMCVFSFHPVKHITTGEGGLITTNSKQLYKKLKSFFSITICDSFFCIIFRHNCCHLTITFVTHSFSYKTSNVTRTVSLKVTNLHFLIVVLLQSKLVDMKP